MQILAGVLRWLQLLRYIKERNFMKKTIFVIFLMSIAIAAFAQNGVIRELSGEVEIKRAGSATFVPATVGSVITQDTIVSTGFRSNAIIEIGSSTITVRPLTRLSLAEIRAAAGAETVNVNLQTGRVRVDVRPPAGNTANFTIQSPTSTASVRGTSFDVNTRSVTVLEGRVAFYGRSGAPVMVDAGSESTVVTGSGTAADPLQNIFENLTPPMPVGTGASREATNAPVITSITGDVIILIDY
jgi:hypothetical protein